LLWPARLWAGHVITTTSAEELAALVEAKVAKEPPQPPAGEPVLVRHLMDALKQSI
jgi:hypothetical protein